MILIQRSHYKGISTLIGVIIIEVMCFVFYHSLNMNIRNYYYTVGTCQYY